jgi:hypothetical protein
MSECRQVQESGTSLYFSSSLAFVARTKRHESRAAPARTYCLIIMLSVLLGLYLSSMVGGAPPLVEDKVLCDNGRAPGRRPDQNTDIICDPGEHEKYLQTTFSTTQKPGLNCNFIDYAMSSGSITRALEQVQFRGIQVAWTHHGKLEDTPKLQSPVSSEVPESDSSSQRGAGMRAVTIIATACPMILSEPQPGAIIIQYARFIFN